MPLHVLVEARLKNGKQVGMGLGFLTFSHVISNGISDWTNFKASLHFTTIEYTQLPIPARNQGGAYSAHA
jgi:hypothetical protein